MSAFDETYTEKCNLQTICDPNKGFFSQFLDCVQSSCGEKWVRGHFGALNDNKIRLESVFEIGEVVGTLEHVSPIFKAKNERVSVQKRLEGDHAAKAGDFRKALILYSQAVIRAPQYALDPNIEDKLVLAKALWSRSAVLVALGNGEKGLQDLKYSQEMGLDIKDNPDYFWRMGQCYTLLGQKRRAQIAFGVTEKLLTGRPSLLTKLEADKSKANDLKDENYGISEKMDLNLAQGESSDFAGTSTLIGVKSSANKGRYFEAKSKIHPGDNLIIEAPVASVLLPSFAGSHCHHCMVKLEAPISCSACSGVAFCSPACKTEANYHDFECHYMDLIIGSGMSMLSQLVLRLVLMHGTPEKAVIANKSLLDNLVTHTSRRPAPDLLNRTIMTSFLLRVLQKCNFFGRRMTEAVDPASTELQVADQMLDLLQALQFNAHEIYETCVGANHRIKASKINYIGVAIYKSASLCNHGCFPSLARYFRGNKLVLTALRPLNTGDAVTENYGPTFIKYSLKERQRMLGSRYWFDCDCQACAENWPTLAQLTNKPRLRCPTNNCTNILRYPDTLQKKIKCTKCKEMVSLLGQAATVRDCEEMYKKAAKEMEEERLEGAIPIFESALKQFYEVALPPHRDTHVALESLRVCYGNRGNVIVANSE